MSSITISNLAHDQALDHKAMSAIRGGSSAWAKQYGALANVNVNVNQDINQFQKVDVNTLNNVGAIGPGFGPLRLNVSPTQFASTGAIF